MIDQRPELRLDLLVAAGIISVRLITRKTTAEHLLYTYSEVNEMMFDMKADARRDLISSKLNTGE